MKIGLFGGSFNPIHVGHIALARQLKKLAGLNEVWLMVSPQNPLKQGRSDLLDDNLRYEMTRLALQGEQGIVASDYELRLPKPSYTWNTLRHLEKDFPEHTFLLLIGGDNWQLFPRWYKSEEILRDHQIIVYPRRGSDPGLSQLPENVTVVETELLDISSTEVRKRAGNGQSIEGMVPRAIEAMVHQYYGSVTGQQTNISIMETTNEKKSGYRQKDFGQPVKRYCQMLDLKDDPELIARYVEAHSRYKAWPEIREGIRQVGILEMEIYILGNRLFMIVDTPLDFDWDSAMARLATLPRQAEWEAYVAVFQGCKPGCTSDEKWQLMERMFYLYE